MRIVRSTIDIASLDKMARQMFGNLVTAVVAVEEEAMAVDGEMHADEEALLLTEGPRQVDLCGINLYPDQFETPGFIEFDSVTNVRPRQRNRTRSVDSEEVRRQITMIVGRLVRR